MAFTPKSALDQRRALANALITRSTSDVAKQRAGLSPLSGLANVLGQVGGTRQLANTQQATQTNQALRQQSLADALKPDGTIDRQALLQSPDPGLQQVALQGAFGPNARPTSAIQNFTFRKNLPSQEKGLFDKVAGADKLINFKDRTIVYDPSAPGGVRQVFREGISPENLPQQAATKARAVEIAKGEAGIATQKKQDLPKAVTRLAGIQDTTQDSLEIVDRALGLTNNMTTGFGSLLSGIPTSDAKTLEELITTLEARLGFDKLQAMRESSPTGGALGQVSNIELNLLIKAVRSLNRAQDPAVVKQNLNDIKQILSSREERYRQAFELDFGIKPPEGFLNNPTEFIKNANKNINEFTSTSPEQIEALFGDIPIQSGREPQGGGQTTNPQDLTIEQIDEQIKELENQLGTTGQ